MKKIWTMVIVAAVLCNLAACGNSQSTAKGADKDEEAEEVVQEITREEITISHKLGETTLTTNPEKVVVMDYGVLDALDYAGVDTVVGIPNSGHVPAELSKYESDDYAELGNLVEPNLETINELQPDLIIITSRMTDYYEDLSEIAPTLFMTMPAATYMETFEENMNILAQVFPVQADSFSDQLDSIKERVEKVAEEAEGKSALLIQTNDDAINVFGIGSRYAAIYTDFGFTITDDSIAASTHGQSASFEYVAEQNPEYLFVIDRSAALSTEGATGAEVLMDNALIKDIDAAKNDHIYYLNATNWYTVAGGISATSAMVGEIEEALGID